MKYTKFAKIELLETIFYWLKMIYVNMLIFEKNFDLHPHIDKVFLFQLDL